MDNDLIYEVLLDHAKQGKRIRRAVLNDLRHQLASGEFRTDPYTLIHILGRSGDLASKDVIRAYLDYNSGDPVDAALVRRITVQVLGRMWALREFFPIIASKAFNEDPYVRAAAATALGFLGSTYSDLKPEAARLLLRGFQDHDPSEPEVWESFYRGLLELMDVPFNEWPPVLPGLTDNDIRHDLLERAQTLANG